MSVLTLVGSIFSVVDSTMEYLEEREKNYPARQKAEAEKKRIALQKRWQKLRKDWYNEYNKAQEDRSNAILDNLDIELRLFLVDYAASFRVPQV